MDTAKVIKRQLSYCLRGAETDSQRAQIQWWIERVAGLEGDQPPVVDQLVPLVPATDAPSQAEAA